MEHFQATCLNWAFSLLKTGVRQSSLSRLPISNPPPNTHTHNNSHDSWIIQRRDSLHSPVVQKCFLQALDGTPSSEISLVFQPKIISYPKIQIETKRRLCFCCIVDASKLLKLPYCFLLFLITSPQIAWWLTLNRPSVGSWVTLGHCEDRQNILFLS